MTPAELSEFCKVMKAHGLAKLTIADVTVEMRAPEQKPLSAEDLKALAVEADDDKCVCGHPHFQHVNGLCTLACGIEKCLPEEARQ